MSPARIALLCLGASLAAAAEPPGARQELNAWLNQLGFAQLETRARAVAAIHIRLQAERRKTLVRQRILGLIGGLPERRGPLPVRQFGAVSGVLLRYDLPGLVRAIAPPPVTIAHPVGALGEELPPQ